jgi:hypothetical protein
MRSNAELTAGARCAARHCGFGDWAQSHAESPETFNSLTKCNFLSSVRLRSQAMFPLRLRSVAVQYIRVSN